MGETNGKLLEKNGKNGKIEEEKSAFLDSSQDTEKDSEGQKEKSSKGNCKKWVLIGGILSLAIIGVAVVVGFLALNGKLEAVISEEGSSNSLTDKNNLAQLNVNDEKSVTTTQPNSEIGGTDATNSAEIDNHDSALEGQQDSLEDTKDEPIVEITSTTVAATVKTTTTTMQTTTMDFCNPDPCNNNGICANDLENNKFTCDCTETGFEGDQCEINIDDCQPESCNNHGICEDLINDFSCKCNTGYDGEQCQNDINECADNPCLNNGVCLDEIGKFACNCSGTGYEGEKCEIDIDECLEEPCNNGECKNSNGSFSCECLEGWQGEFCDTDIDDCEPNPCKNDGVCTDTGANSFTCDCPKYWEGKLCDTAQTKFGIKEVHMTIDPHTGGGGCGGDDTTVQIKIDNKCTTQAKLYPVGTTVHWTAPKDLKDCATNHVFNPKASRLSFHIQPTDKSKYYCINEVVVVLDDPKSTRFAKETDDEWRDGDNTISVPKQY